VAPDTVDQLTVIDELDVALAVGDGAAGAAPQAVVLIVEVSDERIEYSTPDTFVLRASMQYVDPSE
jgi:hypothetical protein